MRQTSLSIWHLQEMYTTRLIAVSEEWHGNETGGLGMRFEKYGLINHQVVSVYLQIMCSCTWKNQMTIWLHMVGE